MFSLQDKKRHKDFERGKKNVCGPPASTLIIPVLKTLYEPDNRYEIFLSSTYDCLHVTDDETEAQRG